MKISFHGADRTVTGSCHLIECAGKRILVDCGMFQGSRELSEDNAEPFGFEPKAIDVVLLTHAHLDHCGRLPLLAKRGFTGEIIATGATRELARLVMLDSARLQEEDAERNKRRHARHHGGNDDDGAPLYAVLDAMNVLEYFGRTAHYDAPLDVAPGIRATFFDAGHILGSASILWNWRRRVLAAGWSCRATSETRDVRCSTRRSRRRNATRWSWRPPMATATTSPSARRSRNSTRRSRRPSGAAAMW